MIIKTVNFKTFRFPGRCHSGVGIIIALLFTILLTGPGCAILGFHFGKQTDTSAEDIINGIKSLNQEILTSRGIGEATLYHGLEKQTYKFAWAAQSPNRLRMTLLMSGHPVETIASTGERVTFVSHTGAHKPYSPSSSDPNLDPFINIPVRLSDLVSLVLGKIPQRPFDRAWIEPEKPDTIFASKSFSSNIQEYLTDETGTFAGYRVLDKEKTMIFGIWYSKYFVCDGFNVPQEITIEDGDQRVIKLSFKKFMANIPVKESVFRLTGS